MKILRGKSTDDPFLNNKFHVRCERCGRGQVGLIMRKYRLKWWHLKLHHFCSVECEAWWWYDWMCWQSGKRALFGLYRQALLHPP